MKKRDDKAFTSRREGKTNARAVTPVNVVAASSTPPTSKPTQLELFPGRACPLEAKPARVRYTANTDTHPRSGVKDDGTRGQNVEITGETRSGPVVASASPSSHGREAHKSSPRKRGPEARPGVGSGYSTDERRDNRREGRTATSTVRSPQGKAAGLPPRGKASSRQKSARRDKRQRMDSARKLQRTLYRVAKSQPHRRFTLLYEW